jgi:hypothetical protein
MMISGAAPRAKIGGSLPPHQRHTGHGQCRQIDSHGAVLFNPKA